MTHHLTSIVLGLALVSGCGSDPSCEDLCTEAQAGGCTTVTGNCGSFCAALDKVDGPANCESQRDAYESCLDSTPDVCDADCDAKESALSSCVGSYCLGHASDPSCVTLQQSF
jgi:hypothetical protein